MHVYNSKWFIVPILGVLLVLAPILSTVIIAFDANENIWNKLAGNVLSHYLINSFLLMFFVGVGVAIIGTYTAWIVTMYRFPGQKILEWLLILPLALPSFLAAFIYTDFLEYAGPIQTAIRDWFLLESGTQIPFLQIRSLGGAGVIMVLVFYPYVFATTRATFLEQSVCLLEASQTLGVSRKNLFRQIAVPLARPAIIAGVSLALMETLNDFGTADFFAVQTLSTGIFDTWFERGNPGGAAQIALSMLGIIMVILTIERWLRANRRYHGTTSKTQPLRPLQIQGFKGLGAMVICFLPPFFGFILPFSILCYSLIDNAQSVLNIELWIAGWNSLKFSTITASLTVVFSFMSVFCVRLLQNNIIARRLIAFSSMGYAIPGAVLAIALIFPIAMFDNWFSNVIHSWFDISLGLVISSSGMGVILACMIRFMAVGHFTILAGSDKLSMNTDLAARVLGLSPKNVIWRVVRPSMRASVLTAFVLVFVETMKELPATLALRPFNTETLATLLYQYASDERLEETAPAALLIVAIGLIPVILLSKMTVTARKNVPVEYG